MASCLCRSDSLCKFVVCAPKIRMHPLHLQILKKEFNQLFGFSDESSAVVAIERYGETKCLPGCARLFVTVQLVEDFDSTLPEACKRVPNLTGDPTCPFQDFLQEPEALVLICTDRFLKHYGLGKEEYVLIRPVQLFPLSKLTLSVRSEQALEFVKTNTFSTGLLLSSCEGPVLIRENDVLLAPNHSLFSVEGTLNVSDIFFDLKVTGCEPVSQGRLAVGTEIIITKESPKKSEIDPGQLRSTKAGEIPSPTSDPFLLSDFLSLGKDCLTDEFRSIGSKSVLELADFSSLESQCPKCVLCVEVVPSVCTFKSMLSVNCDLSSVDAASTIALSKKTLSEAGLFNGSFADIELASRAQSEKNDSVIKKEKSKSNKRKRTVKVYQLGAKHNTGNVLYATADLIFNLCQKVPIQDLQLPLRVIVKKQTVTSAPSGDAGGEWKDSSSVSWKGAVPFASQVHISLVRSPDYSLTANYSSMLKAHFSTPRLVKKGDVLAISSQLDVEFWSDSTESSGSTQPVVYMRVVKILPNQATRSMYKVDTKHTVLYLDGAVNSFIPALMPLSLHGDRTVLPPPGLSASCTELVDILKPYLHFRWTPEDPLPAVLLAGPAGCGKSMVSRAAAASLGVHFYRVNTWELCGDTPASTEARVKAMMARVTSYAPCLVQLKDVHGFAKAADCSTEDPRVAAAFLSIIRKTLTEENTWPVMIVATSSEPKNITADLSEAFLFQVDIKVPTEPERRKMLGEMLDQLSTVGRLDLPRLSQRTAGFCLGDMYTLMTQAHRFARCRIVDHCTAGAQVSLTWEQEEDLVMAGVRVTQQDFEAALEKLQADHSDSIGAPKIPQVSWSDVGGLTSVKQEILDTIQLPLQHPELLAAGLRRSGVLLYGPPGTGKTLLAKAVATECSLNFLSVKGPELLNMYIGQSEENVREVFQRARSAAPCVIFFDELDSLAPNRGRSGDSGGVMDRVVSQLLAELDGMTNSTDVFVIGATNRPDLIDPALLRPGRFDRLLYLGVCQDHASQLHILRALTRKFNLAPGWTLEEIVELCPFNLTGADFYALCSDAMLSAIRKKVDLLEKGEEVDQSKVEVDKLDFLHALSTINPSVSSEELMKYEALQEEFNKQDN